MRLLFSLHENTLLTHFAIHHKTLITFRTTSHSFVLHQYVFTGPEQTQNWIHYKNTKCVLCITNVLCTNMYSPSQNRPRTECIQNTKRITYHKMYCAPICIPQPRAELNSQMQKRLSCSYRLVSRSLNFPVSLWRLHTFCPIFCWCHISKETGPCQTGRALLVVICCKLSSASVYRLKLKLELWSRSKAQSTMACRHPCYQALAIKAYSNLPYCLPAFMSRFLFGHFFLLRLQLSLTYWVHIRKDEFENS